jgi:hypothetical protein
VEPHHEALAEMVRDIQGKLLGLELMARLQGLDLAGFDLDEAKKLARAAAGAVRSEVLGYALMIGRRE